MMEDLVLSTQLESLPFYPAEKIADLIYFDCPLLSLFIDQKNQYFLYYWVDVDEDYNRWLICRISDDNLNRYLISKSLSLRSIITEPSDGFLYKIDIDETLIYKDIGIILPQNLPISYKRGEESYYRHSVINFNNDVQDWTVKLSSSLR